MNKRLLTSHLCAASAVVLATSLGQAAAQTPRAKGETLAIQNYAGTTGNMHAVVAKAKGLCDKYNFKCELKALNSACSVCRRWSARRSTCRRRRRSRWRGSAAGGDVVIVGTSLPDNVLAVSVRNDVPMPSQDKGYPDHEGLQGPKGRSAARGSSSEKCSITCCSEAGMQASDVTYVAVGAPSTAYAALAVGKQIDAAIMFQPLTQLCEFNKTCETTIDMTAGEGPTALQAMNGANIVMRRVRRWRTATRRWCRRSTRQ